MPLVQQSHMDPKTLKIHSNLVYQAFKAINQMDLTFFFFKCETTAVM